eukprot:10880959-Heterocapsa_arctica.AAC.1
MSATMYRPLSWQLTTYNCGRQISTRTTGDLLSKLKGTVVALQRTEYREHVHDSKGRVLPQRQEGYRYQWPQNKGDYSNSSCDVALALDTRRSSLPYVVQVYTPPVHLGGRAGALQLCRYDLHNLFASSMLPSDHAEYNVKGHTNWNGRQLIHLGELRDFVLLNTWWVAVDGLMWTDARGHYSGIDYVAVPRTSMTSVSKVTLMTTTASRLRRHLEAN